MRRYLVLGLVLGAAFGLWNLLATRWDPLADDTPLTLLGFYGPMFALWGLAGFGAARRSGRLVDGVKVGAVVAGVTFLVFDVTVLVRVNMFLDALQQRSDWQNLLQRFHASGAASLRAYANYAYLMGSPLTILVATLIGAVAGLIGGICGSFSRRATGRLPHA